MKVRIAAVLVGVSALSIAAPARPAFAQAAPTVKSYNLPAQNLGSALSNFAEQDGTAIIFTPDSVRGKRAPALRGSYTRDEAISRLLQGSGLRWRSTGSAIVVESAEGNAQSAAAAAAESGGDDVNQEIVVTGTNIRGAAVAAPVITIGRDEIDRAGYSTVESLFDDLPQNLREMSADAGLGTGVSRLASSNSQNAAGISLRGLGAESTLVLLNGRRRPGNINGRVFDISAIPLAIVERVEIVTGGRSAIYGSDAVAGVVNLVTRRSFKGGESQVYVGSATDGGAERVQLSQVLGMDGDRAGFAVAYDFSRDWRLELGDTKLALPSPLGVVSDRIDLQPDSRRHSLFGSGHAELAPGVELYADLLYTRDRNRSFLSYEIPGVFSYSSTTHINSKQYSGVAGVRVALGGDWEADLSGNHGAVRNLERYGSGGSRSRALLTEASAVVQGPLFPLGTGQVRAAFGASRRSEGLREQSLTTGLTWTDETRKITSAFGEVIVPLVTDGPAGLRRVELSAAGRYDRYDDFGDTFNPQAGILWKPSDALGVRGAWSSAFRAPSLLDLSLGNQIFLTNMADPQAGGASTPVLIWFGGNPDLEPETAKTWSIGFDYSPPFASRFKLSVSYFNIAYRGRIDEPSSDRTTALRDEAIFGDLINRMPSEELATSILEGALATGGSMPVFNLTGTPFDPASQNLLNVFPTLVIFDNRRNNIGVDKLNGIDAQLTASLPTGRGLFTLGSNVTLYLKGTRRTTPASPAISELNRPGKPANFRARLNAGWESGSLGLFGYLNYTDRYKDRIGVPVRRVDAWTTVDVTARFDGSKLAKPGALQGITVALSVDNLFNARAPAFQNNIFGFGYDPANASPVGRYVSARLMKRW